MVHREDTTILVAMGVIDKCAWAWAHVTVKTENVWHFLELASLNVWTLCAGGQNIHLLETPKNRSRIKNRTFSLIGHN